MDVFAETGWFEVSAERSTQIYQWDGYGLWLQFPAGASANFRIKVVSSRNFELPEGAELVSPVYLLSCDREIGGPVRVELQHCARVNHEGVRSGLRFIMCKAKFPYQFELCGGQFRSSSSYGRMELELCSKFVAIVWWPMAWGPEKPQVDFLFLAKLYYEKQQQQSTSVVHTVIVPNMEISAKVGEANILYEHYN